jgi:hypothetical protein
MHMDEQRILADQIDVDSERPRGGTMHPEPIRPIETPIVGPATIESLSERREKLKKHLASLPTETELKTQRRENVKRFWGSLPAETELKKYWAGITTLTPRDVFETLEQLRLAQKAEQLWQELRLTNYLIAKLKLIWRTAVSSSKKAVSERCFFVLHETHPPGSTGIGCGLLVGAFQTA